MKNILTGLVVLGAAMSSPQSLGVPTLSVPTLARPIPQELFEYLHTNDEAYRYTVEKVDDRTSSIQMVSQIWQGIAWRNQILVSAPPNVPKKGVAILFITGDGPRPGDYKDVALFTAATRMPVAMLFNIPNQPIWGLKEDDLIAYTFEQYLATGDSTWPLLLPMAKSAVRAMDAIVEATRNTDNPIHSFVVTGASKRGWTTWLTEATGDKRIIGVAPMVYDNLNIPAQMKHQIDSWGAYSEQIQAYTRRGLQAKLETPSGSLLSEIVDPFTYRSKFKAPILIVKGSNDPYWTADATDQYWNELRPPHWIMTVPNAGHTLNGGFLAAQSIGAFARSMAGEFRMPRVQPKLTETDEGAVRKLTFAMGHSSPANRIRPWVALSDTLDFRKETFVSPTLDSANSDTVSFHVPSDRNAAVFLELDYKTTDGLEFSLGTPVKVFAKR